MIPLQLLMVNPLNTCTIYYACRQTKGGYAVIQKINEETVTGVLFHRLKDAKIMSSGGTPEKRGKKLFNIPMHRWCQIFSDTR